MNNKSIFSRRYKLRSKVRFFSVLLIMALLVLGAVYLSVGVLLRSSRWLGQAGWHISRSDQVKSVDDMAAGTGGSEQVTKQNSANWMLMLVNLTHPLPNGFRVKTRALTNGLHIDARIYDELTKMLDDGKSHGLSFVVCSAYRSAEKQQTLFDEQVADEQSHGAVYEDAVEAAKIKVALPGTSEHNLGLAVDIVSADHQQLNEDYADTPECKWLNENAYKYGFILRYLKEKSDITKIIYEPWHYRYVGAEAAKEITRQRVCLEEYLNAVD